MDQVWTNDNKSTIKGDTLYLGKSNFPNMRVTHDDNCSCQYCQPESVIERTSEPEYIDLNKPWRPKYVDDNVYRPGVGVGVYRDSFGVYSETKPEYMTLGPVNKEDIEKARSEINVEENSKNSEDVSNCCYGNKPIDSLSLQEIFKRWDNAQKTEKKDKHIDQQRELETRAGIHSTTNYQKDLKGIVVFYINVGQLPSANAEALIDRVIDSNRAILNRLPVGWEVIKMPVRQGETRIEMLRF